MIKNKISKLRVSSTLRINETSKNLEKKGKKIFKFGFGQSPFNVPDDIIIELKKNAHRNKYLPMQGLLELRKSIAKYTSLKKKYNYKHNNIIIGPGTKELMFLLQLLFDGEILLPIPSWVSYEPQAVVGSNKIHRIETTRDNNWFPTLKDLKKNISKNKKYILFLNSPNNPSGQILKNMEEISKFINRNNIIILSDEIYSNLTFEKNFKSISDYCPTKTIISSGMSKWCGAGGWRLGYFVIPDNLSKIKESLKVLASETFSSVSAPVQFAAISAYKNDHSVYISKSKKILEYVGNYVYENLKSNRILISKPMGGFYLMPEFLGMNYKTSEEMCNDLLKKTGVAMLPGSDFGFKKNKLISRISFTDFNGEKFMKKIKNTDNLNYDMLEKFAPRIVEGTKRLKQWVESHIY